MKDQQTADERNIAFELSLLQQKVDRQEGQIGELIGRVMKLESQ